MGRAENEQRIREVLLALGGSPEALDGVSDRDEEDSASLGSRISAYTRIASTARAPNPAAPAPPASIVSAPLVAPPAIRVPRQRHAARREAGPARVRRAGLPLVAAVAVVVAAVLVVQHRHLVGGHHGQQSTFAAVPKTGVSRAGFAKPRAYARAMSVLSLTNGGTEVDGTPVCGTTSTWRHWTCRAKGRPSLGPYAGRWVTYRCSPGYTPQPGGRPVALLINCRPTAPG